MGSFSLLKADKETKIKNIAFSKPFKFLIPKEFGGGFIKDRCQDYGCLGYKDIKEDEYFKKLSILLNDNIVYELKYAHNIKDIKLYDEIIANNNIEYNYSDLMKEISLIGLFNSKYDMYELLAIWNEPSKVKFNGEYIPLKEIDEHTDFNREIGINIGCYDTDINKLKYPLKLVSVSFKGSYEDLDTHSYGDPVQGFYETKR